MFTKYEGDYLSQNYFQCPIYLHNVTYMSSESLHTTVITQPYNIKSMSLYQNYRKIIRARINGCFKKFSQLAIFIVKAFILYSKD